MTFARPQRELAQTIHRFVDDRFGGDYHRAFSYFDREKDGTINLDELQALLEEAEWGNPRTRPAWARSVLAAFDTDDDEAISWIEFECGLAGAE